MFTGLRSTLAAVITVGALSPEAASAMVLTYDLFLDGFDGGGTFSATMEVEDYGANGQIDGPTELVSFAGVFSGNSFVPDSSFSKLNVGNIQLDLTTSTLWFLTLTQQPTGGSTVGFYTHNAGPAYAPYSWGGFGVYDPSTGSTYRYSNEYMTATQVDPTPPGVPLPASALLLAGALSAFGAARRRRVS